jgi:protein required for attachment to host cells
MNMNSLVIAADASRARLFRTAQTNVGEHPVELIEIDVLDDSEAQAHDAVELRRFAEQIAERAAQFARYHFCNPVVLAAPSAVSSVMLAELERKLSNVYIHPIIGDMARLPARALMLALQERAAFISPLPSAPGSIPLA